MPRSMRKRKASKATLILLSILLFLMLFPSFASAAMLGDVNEDGKINVLDVVLTVQYVLEIDDPPLTEAQKIAADVNGNGVINVLDITLLMQYALGMIDEFPAPPVEPDTYTLTMAVNPAAGGTATDVTGQSPYEEGTAVSISATANTGYVFTNWTASAGSFVYADNPSTTFTMPGSDVTVTANFEAIAGSVDLTGDATVEADLITASGTYTAALIGPAVGAEVVFELTGFVASDINSISIGNIPDLLSGGVTISSDTNGEAELTITFAAGVNKNGTLTASIDDTDPKVDTTASDNQVIAVNTTEAIASSVTLTGNSMVTGDNSTASGTYTATLSRPAVGAAVVFTLAGFTADDIDSISSGNIDDLLAGGVTVLSNASGKAELVITFAAGVDKGPHNLTATISDADPKVDTNASDTQAIRVNTKAWWDI